MDVVHGDMRFVRHSETDEVLHGPRVPCRIGDGCQVCFDTLTIITLMHINYLPKLQMAGNVAVFYRAIMTTG